MLQNDKKIHFSNRFRGLLPVVVDVETSGLSYRANALLEIAAVTLKMDEFGKLSRDQTFTYHVEPFFGAAIDPESIAITGIDPFAPLRYAIPEKQALFRIFSQVEECLKQAECSRAVLVGHNSWFDLHFLKAAAKRAHLKSPFHSFTSFDTATLGGVVLGETVLAKALRAANIEFDMSFAHTAAYDAEKTAELFCFIVNQTKFFGI